VGAKRRLAMTASSQQLILALGYRESLAREDYLRGPCNAAALELIERWPDWPSPTIALVGPEGSGKSHLAAIWAATAGAPIIDGRRLEAAIVPQLLAAGALVIEEAGHPGIDEAALFHLLNLAKEERAYVLLTAGSAPVGWPIALPDLASRLRALPVATLEPPDDATLAALLVKLFADRQLAVDEALISYLGKRIERSFAGARTAVAALDEAAMRLKRPVNRALAAEILRGHGP
jgi:chromosomal replication initiation ATPase DnaA